jgi:hypothetical protein
MPRKQGSHGIGILLREFGTAFDIGEQELPCLLADAVLSLSKDYS